MDDMTSLEFGGVYEVVSGSFKGDCGLLQAGFTCGILWLKTGTNCRVLVTKEQIKLVKKRTKSIFVY